MSFSAVQAKIAKSSGEGMKNAGAILAAATRRASPAAKKANPKLKRVLMPQRAHRSEEKAKKGVADFFAKHEGA